MCSTINLTIKTGVLNVNVEYILHLALVFLQLSLSRYIPVGCGFNLLPLASLFADIAVVTFTSSHRKCSLDNLKNFGKLTGKNMCQSLFLNKVAEACNFM